MGLKDWIDRLRGTPAPARGRRGRRSAPRERHDPTLQIPTPPRPGEAAGPAAPPLPPSPQPAAAAPPVAAAPLPPVAPARAPAPPAAPAHAPIPPQPAAAAPDSAAKTQYHAIPALGGAVLGVLVGLDGDEEGEVYTVGDGRTRLGRSETCDVVFRSGSLRFSREHAEIVHDGGLFVVASLADQNPIFVNGKAVDGAELKDGDALRLGRTTFRFRTIEGP